MSGYAVGGAVFGGIFLIGALLPLIAAVLAGTAAIAATVGAYRLTRAAVQTIRKAHQTRAQQQARVLQALESPVAREASQRQQEAETLYRQTASQMDAVWEKAEREANRTLSEAKSLQADACRQTEQLLSQTREAQRDFENTMSQQMQAFHAQAEVAVRKAGEGLARSLRENGEAARREIEAIRLSVAETRAREVAYAQARIGETRTLHEALLGDGEWLRFTTPAERQQPERCYQTCAAALRDEMSEVSIAIGDTYAVETLTSMQTATLRRATFDLLQEQTLTLLTQAEAYAEASERITLENAKLRDDGDFWADGRLTPLAERLAEARRCFDAVQPDMEGLAVLQTLAEQVQALYGELQNAGGFARAQFIGSYHRGLFLIQTAKKLQSCGWSIQTMGFEGGDERKAMGARFGKAGATVDVLLAPVYDASTGRFGYRISVERNDAGVIDEGLRNAQLEEINRLLSDAGAEQAALPVCDPTTMPTNMPRVRKNERFAIPQNRPGSSV